MNKVIDTNLSLEKNVFQEKLDYKIFQEILDILDGIETIFISRKEFNEKKWTFLEETTKDKFGMQYILYLPEDLKVNELPSIIYKVNKLTFWEELPEYASSNELKIKIVLAVNALLGELKKDAVSWKEAKRAIRNYVRLYAQMFGEEEAQQLNKAEYREGVLNTRNIDKFENYEKKLTFIQTLESLGELEEWIEKLVSEEVESHFLESFLEKWVDKLRLWMMTITQREQEALDFNKIKNKKHSETEMLDEKERLLREKIWIDDLKLELEEIRKTGDLEKINTKELEATNKILATLFEYPYQMTNQDYGYQPNSILRTKEIYCVWFSLIWHAFLSELWIKHNWLSIPEHSALEVIIWGQKHYFDGTASEKLLKIEYGEKIWVYTKITVSKWKKAKSVEARSWDPEKILFSAIYNNRWINLNDMGKHKEAHIMYSKAIESNTQEASAHFNKWNNLNEAWRFEEAILSYDTVIKLVPNEANVHYKRWNALYHLGKYEEAILSFDTVIKLVPNEPNSYYKKWVSLWFLWKGDIAVLFTYIWYALKWQNPPFEITHNEIVETIDQFIQNKDFELLRLYMKTIEKEEKN